jgi:signal transduction histidine kinase/ActR/RegA family two-component response regulator
MVLLGCTKGIVFEFDREGRYLNVWTHDDALLARPKPELLGRTINEILGPEVGNRFTDAVRRVFDSGKAETLDYDLSVQGGQRWFSADVVRSPSVGGRPPTVVYLVRDVTASKHVEEQLRQAQKMEAVGQLAGGIAHDFNNILTTILGYSEILVSILEDDSPERRYATCIRDSAKRAGALTGQLLAYSRKQVLVPEVLDANEVICTMGQMLQRVIGEDIELELELDPLAGAAKMDRSGLEQIIMNLLLNARDAMSDGGTVRIATRHVELDHAHCSQRVDVTPGSYVQIVTTDDGRGMDAATRARIFEPFFTTKEFGKGTGLGLSIVYGIVKHSGGHIEVESAPNRGTRFSIFIPRLAQPAEASAHTRLRRPATRDRIAKVLVVEDDAEVRQLLEHHLLSDGYDVVSASDALQVQDLMREPSFDLLVTDIVLPGMRGDLLAKLFCELHPDGRVLFISGYVPGLGAGHLGAPAVRHRILSKPFHRDALLGEAAALLETTGHGHRRHHPPDLHLLGRPSGK